YCRKRDAVQQEIQRLRSTWINPRVVQSHSVEELLGQPLEKEASAYDLLKRPRITYKNLVATSGENGELLFGPGVGDPKVAEQVEIQVKYAGYIQKQKEEVERQQAQENLAIPEGFDYDRVPSLSFEARARLKQAQPATVGQASRVSGITPAAVSLLLIQLKREQAAARVAT